MAIEQSALGSQRRDNETEFNLKEWGLKARISRDNTLSRRFSASYIRSFREDARSFRSNITISSTASSPGYALREEIDPSTYSFTTALKALQAKTIYTWECNLSPDGFALNSKWNEAEKYICNPLSGEVPLECLSAKTLTGRSFRDLRSRITMSAPLIYPSNARQFQMKPPAIARKDDALLHNLPAKEKKTDNITKDVGTQSTPPQISSGSPTPAPTPPIEENPIKHSDSECGDSSVSSAKLNSEEEVKVKITVEKEEDQERETSKGKGKQRCSSSRCLSWRSLWMRRRQREDTDKPRNFKKGIFVCHSIGC